MVHGNNCGNLNSNPSTNIHIKKTFGSKDRRAVAVADALKEEGLNRAKSHDVATRNFHRILNHNRKKFS